MADSDGNPILNAGITVRGMASLPLATAITVPTTKERHDHGAKGRYQDFQILVMADNHVTAGAAWRGDGVSANIPDGFTFTLEKGNMFGGIVRDEQENPSPGRRLR